MDDIMELKIKDILDNIKILKSCLNCHCVNHIKNRECVTCGNKSFDYRDESTIKSYEKEMNYFINEENYSLIETMDIIIEI